MLNNIAWMFITYGILGWLWETTFVSLREKRFINRGFLRGPIIPLYSFASVTMLVSLKWLLEQLSIKPLYQPIVIVLYAATLASLWEYAISYLMEKAFATRWWDYSHLRYNLNGRIALRTSAFWGVGGLMLWQYIHPALSQVYTSPIIETARWVLPTVYGLLAVDAVITLSELIQHRQVLSRLHYISEGIFDVLSNRLERLEESFDQQEPLRKMLYEARNDLRFKTNYIRLEGISDFSYFVSYLRTKAKTLLKGYENRLDEFMETLSKANRHARFYKSFPRAITKKLPYIRYVINLKNKTMK